MSREQDHRRIEFLLNELQQRTEQLAISQEHVAKLQEENRRLAAVEAEYRWHRHQGRSTADHQLAADIKALTARVSQLESGLLTVGYRIGGTLSKRS